MSKGMDEVLLKTFSLQGISGDTIELMINSDRGASAFGIVESDTPNVALEVVFVLEPVAQSHLHVERFLSPEPLRVIVDIRGGDLSRDWSRARMRAGVRGGSVARFLEAQGMNQGVIGALLEGAESIASATARKRKTLAKSEMRLVLSREVERLVDLRKINDAVRQEEIQLAKREIKDLEKAIEEARLRLDSARLLAMGDVGAFGKEE